MARQVPCINVSKKVKRYEMSKEKPAAQRVRIVAGPNDAMIGRIGYLFHHEDIHTQTTDRFIVTISKDDVHRLRVTDGYEYELAEIA